MKDAARNRVLDFHSAPDFFCTEVQTMATDDMFFHTSAYIH